MRVEVVLADAGSFWLSKCERIREFKRTENMGLFLRHSNRDMARGPRRFALSSVVVSGLSWRCSGPARSPVCRRSSRACPIPDPHVTISAIPNRDEAEQPTSGHLPSDRRRQGQTSDAFTLVVMHHNRVRFHPLSPDPLGHSMFSMSRLHPA